MKTLSIDVETSSKADLTVVGSIAYAMDPTTKCQLFGFSFDYGDVYVIDLATGEEMPREVCHALWNPEYLKTAFNAQFEIGIIRDVLGLETPLSQWQCSQALAMYNNYPAALANVIPALGLDEKYQKLKEGADLVKIYSVQSDPDTTTPQWKRYKEYNRQDVIAEMQIPKRLGSLPPRESAIWRLTYLANKRGVQVDKQYVENAIRLRDTNKESLKSEMRELSGAANPGSRKQILDWINGRLGTSYDSLAKDAIPVMLKEITDTDVLKVLRNWSKLNKSSLAKYNVILDSQVDGRVYTGCAYYGASQTGRWASYGLQFHNLPKTILDLDENDAQLIIDNDYDFLTCMYDNVSDFLSQSIRGSFIPKPGHKFIIADFSAIEARMLAWLANELWRMEVFATTGKIYEASAEKMFNLPPGSVDKKSPQRTYGKVAELALGYGGWVKALERMCTTLGIPPFSEEQAVNICRSWRNANKKITQLWYKADRLAQSAVAHGTRQELCHGIWFKREGKDMRIELPSGRDLVYHNAAVHSTGNKIDILFKRPYSSGMMLKDNTYGAKMIENIDQGLSRDCLAETMIRLHKADIPVVFHVHDEVICEVLEEQAEEALDVVRKAATTPISWAPGLILGVEAFIADRYTK